MTEYIVVLSAGVLTLLAVLVPLRRAIESYLHGIYAFVGLPIP